MVIDTELVIHPFSAKRWQVIERLKTDGVSPLAPPKIKLLITYSKKELAVAFAEGRQSVTGQSIAQ